MALGAIGVLACRGDRGQPAAFPTPGENGTRITVEVLNASPQPGLARTGTRILRRAGLDVVGFGNAPAREEHLDSTRIIVRRGDRAVGERVRQALGVGTVLVRLDSTRLLDVSVFLGRDFSPHVRFHP